MEFRKFLLMLLVRKWNKKKRLGGSQWEFEIGEQLSTRNVEVEGMMESLSNVCHCSISSSLQTKAAQNMCFCQ